MFILPRDRPSCRIDVLRASPAPLARRRVREAWSRLNMALHEYRAVTVRAITAEDGLSLADIARVTGNARQVVSRLYHSSRLGSRSVPGFGREAGPHGRETGATAT